MEMLKTGSTPRDRAVRSNANPNPNPSTGSAIEPIPKTSLMVALSNAGSKRRPEGASSSMQLTSKEAKLKNSKPTPGDDGLICFYLFAAAHSPCLGSRSLYFLYDHVCL